MSVARVQVIASTSPPVSILPEAQFNYVVRLRRGPDAVWRGTATATPDEPHLVGATPGIELANGVLSIVGPTSHEPRRRRRSVETYPISSRAAMAVGDTLEAVLRDDDVIDLDRGPMGTVGIVVSRDNQLVVALGDVTRRVERFGISIVVDPRADDVRFYYMKSLLDRPDALLVWLDPASPAYESQLEELEHVPRDITMVSLAARCSDWKASSEVNGRVTGVPRRWGFNFETVSPRFATREDFIDYLRSLPSARPRDFFLAFTVDGQPIVVREGETRAEAGWLIHVDEVSSPDWGWEPSAIGMARAHPGLSADALKTSVQQITHKHMQIEKR